MIFIQIPSLRDELSQVIDEVENGEVYGVIDSSGRVRAVILSQSDYQRLQDDLERLSNG